MSVEYTMWQYVFENVAQRFYSFWILKLRDDLVSHVSHLWSNDHLWPISSDAVVANLQPLPAYMWYVVPFIFMAKIKQLSFVKEN